MKKPTTHKRAARVIKGSVRSAARSMEFIRGVERTAIKEGWHDVLIALIKAAIAKSDAPLRKLKASPMKKRALLVYRDHVNQRAA